MIIVYKRLMIAIFSLSLMGLIVSMVGSEALDEDGYFCGLAIDEDNEPELTKERLENWLSILKSDFEF